MDFRRSWNCDASASEPNERLKEIRKKRTELRKKRTEIKKRPKETNFSWNGLELGVISRSCKSTSEKKSVRLIDVGGFHLGRLYLKSR
jgi:uncharacterized protein YyaL (SSP411 family)